MATQRSRCASLLAAWLLAGCDGPAAPDDAGSLPPPPLPSCLEPAPAPSADFVLGTRVGATFVPYGADPRAEIVQGTQGGIHLDLAYRARLSADWPGDKVIARVSAVVCVGGEAAATLASRSVLFAEGGVIEAGPVPVIFEQTDPSLVSGACELRVAAELATALGEPARMTEAAAVALTCVDQR